MGQVGSVRRLGGRELMRVRQSMGQWGRCGSGSVSGLAIATSKRLSAIFAHSRAKRFAACVRVSPHLEPLAVGEAQQPVEPLRLVHGLAEPRRPIKSEGAVGIPRGESAGLRKLPRGLGEALSGAFGRGRGLQRRHGASGRQLLRGAQGAQA
eukprot:630002-Prymnesium_polylepis.1